MEFTIRVVVTPRNKAVKLDEKEAEPLIRDAVEDAMHTLEDDIEWTLEETVKVKAKAEWLTPSD